MEKKILEKLKKMDKNLNGRDKKFTGQLSAIDKTLNEHTEQIDLIASKVAEHDTDIKWLKENAATKGDLQILKDEMFTRFDEIVGLLKTQKQETAMIQYRTQENTKEIKQIKSFVHFK